MPWASFAPRLAGLPAGYTQEQIVHFLMTGERPDGRPGPLPPMPAYRFEREDAEAIVAYLKSLPAEASQR
jgi:mono/diheme cytochrome c family protein